MIDILQAAESGTAVAIVDDDASRWAGEVMGVPVVGGFERLVTLFGEGAFDAAIIAISTSVPARARLREALAANGIPLANAIDPTARIAAGVTFGTGNVVCAFCHFGVGTVVGDNNFLSAYNSYDHHNRLGSDISTGPACATSGLVVLGDRVRLGTGIYVEPHVELGDDVQVASGSVIVASVPAGHAVKRRAVTTVVVPRRWQVRPVAATLTAMSEGDLALRGFPRLFGPGTVGVVRRSSGMPLARAASCRGPDDGPGVSSAITWGSSTRHWRTKQPG